MNNWTYQEAVALCRTIENVCPAYGCHVALTGGLLYKNGERKDADILFYRIQQRKKIKRGPLCRALSEITGLQLGKESGWITKATLHGKNIDFFFPEDPNNGEKYPVDEPTKTTKT